MKFLRRFCAVVIGITFIVSGLAKIMDPAGTMLIVTEYLRLIHFGFLIPAAKVLGIILATLEAVTGIALVTGVLRKVAAWITIWMVGGFTIITLCLLIMNPSMDCGCFGEAIHLNHLQSFLKNLALAALCAIAFIPLKNIGKAKSRKWVSFGLATLAIGYAVLYSNTHIPILDFTDFKPGCELMASLDDEDDWDASKTYPILSFRNSLNEYCDSLAVEGPVVTLSVYEPSKANWERIHRHYLQIQDAGALPLLLVASYPLEIDRFDIPIDMTVYYADYKTLITLNRSNGGASYFLDGELIEKWHQRAFPESIAQHIAADPVERGSRFVAGRRIKSQAFCLGLAIVLIVL
ncbi:MAG: DoxX family protein [Bacteroidales bacterium]|nr:DoxX family protein [Bacteroidales bacterium]